MYCLYTGKSKISMAYVTFYLSKSVQNIKIFDELNKFGLFGRPSSDKVIVQVMAKYVVSNN